MQFDCACLCCTVCFQMNSWETSVAFCPAYILVSPPCCYSYYTSQQVHHFHSVFHPLPLSVFFYWVFEPGMGPGAIVKHAFFLPKFCLCVLQPHWGLPSPFPVYSSFVASRKAFISHLFSSSPLPTAPFLLVPPTPPSLRKKTGSECRCRTHLSSLLILSFSLPCVLSFSLSSFFRLQTDPHGWSSCYITHWTHWHSEPHSGGCPSQ